MGSHGSRPIPRSPPMPRPSPLATCIPIVLLAAVAGAGDRFCVSDTGSALGTDDRVWALEDLNADGDFDDPGEVAAFYDESVGGIAYSNGTGVGVGPDGSVFVCDSTDDIVLRLRDANGDGDAHGPGYAGQ